MLRGGLARLRRDAASSARAAPPSCSGPLRAARVHDPEEYAGTFAGQVFKIMKALLAAVMHS
jgi:hypothetical protein